MSRNVREPLTILQKNRGAARLIPCKEELTQMSFRGSFEVYSYLCYNMNCLSSLASVFILSVYDCHVLLI